MKPIVPSFRVAIAVAALVVPTFAAAADAPPPAASTPPSRQSTSAPAESPADRAEPNVKLIIIDGDSSHIEELRVRGVPQRITVTPKIGPKATYEIITGDGSRDLSPGVNTSRGAAGQRVWNVLTF